MGCFIGFKEKEMTELLMISLLTCSSLETDVDVETIQKK